MKTSRWLAPVLGLLLAGPVMAADYGSSEQQDKLEKTEVNRAGKAPPATKKSQKLAREFDANPADVQALRDRGMGWGEIRHALWISQRSGKPVNEIVELRDSGMGWGEIAARYNLPPSGPEEKRGTATTVGREQELKERRGKYGADTLNTGREGEHIDREIAEPRGQESGIRPVPEPSVLPSESEPAQPQAPQPEQTNP